MINIIRTTATLCLTVVLFTGCDKARELTIFEISTTSEVVVPATAGVNLPINLITPDVETNASSTFDNNNTRADLIEEIYLSSSELTITSPDSADFDFLKSIQIYISASNLPEVLIAERQDLPNGMGKNIPLNVQDEDLTEYMKQSEIDIRTRIVTDEIPGYEIHINIDNIFIVDAEILGL